MNAVQQAASCMRRAIGLVLILLFGPAPLITLLAQSNEPQCQMACCKRKSFARSCALHRPPAPESSSLGFHAVAHCPVGCSQAAAAPSAFADVFLTRVPLSLPHTGKNPIPLERASGVRWILDSYLYQRPPPDVLA